MHYNIKYLVLKGMFSFFDIIYNTKLFFKVCFKMTKDLKMMFQEIQGGNVNPIL